MHAYTKFGLVGFYSILTPVCQILLIHIYQIYMISKHTFWITSLNKPGTISFCSQLNGFKYCYVTLTF